MQLLLYCPTKSVNFQIVAFFILKKTLLLKPSRTSKTFSVKFKLEFLVKDGKENLPFLMGQRKTQDHMDQKFYTLV